VKGRRGNDTMDTARAKFDRLFEAFETPVRNYCARRVGHHEVDDAVNDTFAVAWRKIDLAPDGPAGLPWLYGVAYRVIQHAWRTNGRAVRLATKVGAHIERPAHSLDDDMVEADNRRRVLEAAARLEAADQEILRLTLWEELSPTEAATILGLTPEAARQRASRARSRLADEFRRLDTRPSTWARPAGQSREGTQS
jgi:RNA polymerase sigma-70 factor (ECF subfamily)